MKQIWKRGLLLLPLPFVALPLIAVVIGGSSKQVAITLPAASVNTTGPTAGAAPGETTMVIRAGERVFRVHFSG